MISLSIHTDFHGRRWVMLAGFSQAVLYSMELYMDKDVYSIDYGTVVIKERLV